MPTELLYQALRDSTDSHQSVALEWLERWNRANPGSRYKATTAESRFSELVAGKAKGVRFFGKERQRVALLAEALGLDADGAIRLHGAFDDWRRRDEASEVAALLDVSTLEGRLADPRPLFRQIESLLARVPELRPCALRLSDEQYDQLPRSFDLLDGVQIVRGGALPALATGALVLSEAMPPPPNGAVIGVVDGELRVVPDDAVETWVAHGTVRDLPDVLHPLTCRAEDDDVARVEGLEPWQLRALAFEITDEQLAAAGGRSAAERAAWAVCLQVTATSTADEREAQERAQLERALRDAGWRPERESEAGWSTLLEQAELRTTEDVLREVSGRYRLLNPTREPPAHPLLEVVRVQVVPRAFDRLQEATAAFTVDDWLDDPALSRVAARLRAAGVHAEELAHARRALLFGLDGELAQSNGNPELLPALRTLFGGPPPPAELLVCDAKGPTSGFDQGGTRWLQPRGSETHPSELMPHALPARVRRGDQLCRVSVDTCRYNVAGSRRLGAADRESWLAQWERRRRAGVLGHHTVEVEVSAALYEEADRLVGLLWLHCRRALGGDVIALHDGRLLCSMAPGLAIEVVVRVDAASDEPAAFVGAEASYRGVLLSRYRVSSTEVRDERVSRSLPFVRVRGHGVLADVAVVADPFSGP
jgi:hypothetical protein